MTGLPTNLTPKDRARNCWWSIRNHLNWGWLTPEETHMIEGTIAVAIADHAADVREMAAKLADSHASTLPECAGNEWDAACRAIAKAIRGKRDEA